MDNYLKYNIDFVIIQQGQPVASNCNEITFFNLGTAQANVELVPLLQNQQFKISGNIGEMCQTQFNISFTGTGTQLLLVIRKNYV